MRGERGAALIVVMLLTLTLVLFGAGVSWFATNQLRYVRTQEFGVRALALAEAALNQAYLSLPAMPSPPAYSSTLPDGTVEAYSVLHKTLVTTGKWDIWVKGEVHNAFAGATRYLKARVTKAGTGSSATLTIHSWREQTPDEYERDKLAGGW